MGLGNNLEGFATIARPLIQIANLNAVVASAQSVVFNFNPGGRSCGTTNTSTTVTCVNTYELAPGMVVSGTGIPTGAVILSIVPNTSFVISIPATATATNTLSFNNVNTTGSQIVRVRIVNVSANPCSLYLTDANETAVRQINSAAITGANPGVYSATTMATGTATTVVAGDGIRIQGASTLEINVSVSTRLWFIGTATAAQLNIVGILQNG